MDESQQWEAARPGEEPSNAMMNVQATLSEDRTDIEMQKIRDNDGTREKSTVPGAVQSGFWDTSKGEASCIFTFVVMVIGVFLTESSLTKNATYDYVLAFGLFGFAGGSTNWLAVKMLFDRVPFLIGSGVIPRQFKGIRQSVKDTIMTGFFDEQYMEQYLRKRSATMMKDLDLAKMITDFMAKPEFDELLTEKLTAMAAKPEGMMINTMAPMFGGVAGMVPIIKPILQAIGKEVGEELARTFDPLEVITVSKIRTELDALMTEKLQQLTPQMVKKLLENVIRRHLGWLVVWGNIFGALIGVISKVVGYGK
jgi:uncharacterized membrane protein YheB (UPF0754 family)